MTKKILIVEDEEYIAEMYKLKLEIAGYDVRIAPDGVEGVRQVHEYRPDLVLLDLIMPNKDGYQVIKEIREDSKVSKTKILILSNLGQKEEIERGLSLGADGFFIKAHLTPSQLLDNLPKYL